MQARIAYEAKSRRRESVRASGSFTTGTDGDVATDADAKTCGFSVSQIIDDPSAAELGRYLVTFDQKFADVELEAAFINGAADAAYASNKGLVAFLRDKDATARTAILQFISPFTTGAAATYVDANIVDATVVDLSFLLHL